MAPLEGAQAPISHVIQASIFETCSVGVVLRGVLFVEAVVAVAAMFSSARPAEWLLQFSLLTGGALPATLVWLVVTCWLKTRLSRLALPLQWVSGIGLGVMAGLYGCGVLNFMGVMQPAPWWSSGAAGALLSSMLLAGLFWRARARTPAATTARLAELQSHIRPHF